MFKNKALLFAFHVVAWAIFLLFPLFAFQNPLLINNQAKLIIYFSGGIATICFYYLNYYFIIPQFLFKHKYIISFVLYFAFIVISILITQFVISLDFVDKNVINSGKPKLLGNFFLRFLIIFMIALAIRFYEKMKQIEAEQINSELAKLKAQINPHFLFNTLNGIYGLALTKSEKTAEYISKLSSMMRYALSDSSAEKNALENEINYLSNYIELQKIRLTETTTIVFSVTGNIDSQQIPPLLFINFIENAFKYGVSNELETEILIHINVDKNRISLQVKNDKINQNHISFSHGQGLKNIKQRLDLIFENHYTLKIENNKKTFEVNLEIYQK